jgi:hypothetical protein
MTDFSNRRATFYERRNYRQRRMMDALRLLPVLGAMLWMLPLFWPQDIDGVAPVGLEAAIVYIFAIWVLLILTAFGLSLVLKDRLGEGPPEDAAKGDD